MYSNEIVTYTRIRIVYTDIQQRLKLKISLNVIVFLLTETLVNMNPFLVNMNPYVWSRVVWSPGGLDGTVTIYIRVSPRWLGRWSAQ